MNKLRRRPTWQPVVLAAFLIWALTSKMGIAETLAWSFETHLHPLLKEQSATENDRLRKALYKNEPISCLTGNRIQFEIYKEHYPAYTLYGNDHTERYEAWKHHVYATKRDIDLLCLMRFEEQAITHQVEKFKDYSLDDPLDYEGGLLYCGKFVNRDRSNKSEALAEKIEKFLTYVRLNEPRWAHEFLSAFEFSRPTVILHPDIEYYFKKRFVWENWQQTVYVPDTRHPDHIFTPERLAFLDDAVARGDLQSVIDSMGACLTPVAPWQYLYEEGEKT